MSYSNLLLKLGKHESGQGRSMRSWPLRLLGAVVVIADFGKNDQHRAGRRRHSSYDYDQRLTGRLGVRTEQGLS
jgi:hypothetical protein